jgi:hypothetical protein
MTLDTNGIRVLDGLTLTEFKIILTQGKSGIKSDLGSPIAVFDNHVGSRARFSLFWTFVTLKINLIEKSVCWTSVANEILFVVGWSFKLE